MKKKSFPDLFTRERKLRSVRFAPYRPGMGPRFCLTIYDTYERDSMGKSVLGYKLTQDGKTLFAGCDFHCAPGNTTDGNACVESLMSFLTLRPGDIDSDYFKDYNEKQKDYCSQHAESLACEVQFRFCDENGRVIE